MVDVVYYRLPRLLQWATGNIGLHHIHHLHPRIPNYRLQQALDDHAELRQVPTLTLWESLRCVRLTLWDERARKLVPFAAVREGETQPPVGHPITGRPPSPPPSAAQGGE